ncbi:hypothetical protein ACWODC_05965 [Enterococcus raffinosus]
MNKKQYLQPSLTRRQPRHGFHIAMCSPAFFFYLIKYMFESANYFFIKALIA